MANTNIPGVVSTDPLGTSLARMPVASFAPTQEVAVILAPQTTPERLMPFVYCLWKCRDATACWHVHGPY